MYGLNLFDFCSHLKLNRHTAEVKTASSRHLGNCMSSLISEAFSDCTTTLINKRGHDPLKHWILDFSYCFPFRPPTPFWTAPISCCCCDKAREWLRRVHFRGHDCTNLASVYPKQLSESIPTLKPQFRPSRHPLRKALSNISPPWQL